MDAVQKPASRRGGKRPGAGRKRKRPLPRSEDFEAGLFDKDLRLRMVEAGNLLIAAGLARIGKPRLPHGE